MTYDEPEAFDPDEDPDDKQLSHDIDEALAKLRPERYDADDKDWMAPIVATVEDILARRPSDEVIRSDARRRVFRREAEATKHLNRILRDIDDTGDLPLGWGEGDTWRELLYDVLNKPLSIARQRVRFGVANANDLEQWELESAREEDKRRAAQISARSGARLLARLLREQGAERIEDLRNGAGGAS